MVELSDLEEAGSALLLGDECGTGVDALAFDDAEASDVGADVADVNVDDEVEESVSPTVAASKPLRFITTTARISTTPTILPTLPHRRVLVLPLQPISTTNHGPA